MPAREKCPCGKPQRSRWWAMVDAEGVAEYLVGYCSRRCMEAAWTRAREALAEPVEWPGEVGEEGG